MADKFFKLAKKYKLFNKLVIIVTTAAVGKSKNKYCKLTYQEFKKLGFTKIKFVNLEKNISRDLLSSSVIYVAGGNSFKLLKYTRIRNFRKIIEDLLKRGGIYIGASAGSVIMGSTIKSCSVFKRDENKVGLKDFSGLNFVPYEIYPHYKAELNLAIKEYEKVNKIKVARLKDGECIIL
ncbi:MAG: Type 1 glutamine amidotransferase-like domain-containing protein [Patescibacteria group bacterium]